MKNQNTSKLSGEWDIKLKDKTANIIKIILILAAGILAVAALFRMVDTVFNGFFGNWFENNYMSVQTYTNADGGYDTVTSLDWFAIKNDLLIFLTIVTVFWLSVILIAISLFRKRMEQQIVDDIGRGIHQYVNSDADASSVFPDNYAKISAEMAEIKSGITRKEQLLKEEASRKNDLITYLAHDLKTPLTSVIGYLSLLDEVPDMPAEQKAKYVHISLDKALRLEKLINEFFEITRYNLQQIYLEKETIELSYMLLQMSDEFYPLLKAHNNTIEVKSEEELTVHAAPEKLARIFNNILKNAIAYSYPGTRITVEAFSSSDSVHIIFRNKGKTIPAQKLESIFEKFFRLDDARAAGTGGAGLGLAIAREIVTLHGGTITASSENECTSFTICLPLHP